MGFRAKGVQVWKYCQDEGTLLKQKSLVSEALKPRGGSVEIKALFEYGRAEF